MNILCFSPFAAIWQHSVPEALMVESLAKQGHTIYYMTCDSVYRKGCTVMAARGMNFPVDAKTQQKTCQNCHQYQKLLLNKFPFKPLEIKSLIKNSQAKIKRVLDTLTKSNAMNFEIDGMPIGKYAAYLIILKYKKSDPLGALEEWAEFKIEIENLIITYYATQAALEKIKPELGIVYNPVYPSNRVFAKLVSANGADLYWLHAGLNWGERLQKMIFCKEDTDWWENKLMSLWRNGFAKKPCSVKGIEATKKHFAELLKGQAVFVYSSQANKAVDLKQFFDIQPEQKVVLAATSSDDERLAAELIDALQPIENACFDDQISWLKHLIEHFTPRKDVKLIIRIHPRSFSNKSESVVSEFAHVLKATLQNLPDNIVVNWPSQKISLYQMIDMIDLCLHAGSSVAKECAVFGIPSVNFIPHGITYPKELVYFASDPNTYFERVSEAIERGKSIEYSIQGFRWYALDLEYGPLDLSDAFTIKEYEKKSFWKRIVRKVQGEKATFNEIKKEIAKRPKTLGAHFAINKLIDNRQVIALEDPSHQNIESLSLEEEKTRIAQTVEELKQLALGVE